MTLIYVNMDHVSRSNFERDRLINNPDIDLMVYSELNCYTGTCTKGLINRNGRVFTGQEESAP